MKRIIIGITAVILVGVSIFSVKTYNASSKNFNASVEKTYESNAINDLTKSVQTNSNVTKAIDFKLKDLDGKEVSLSDLKGKKVFLNFWATWCPPCKAEMPEIEKLYQETDAEEINLTK